MGEARELGERWFDTVTKGDPDATVALLSDDLYWDQATFMMQLGLMPSPGQ